MFVKIVRLTLTFALVLVAVAMVTPVRHGEAVSSTCDYCEHFAEISELCRTQPDAYGGYYCWLREWLLRAYPDLYAHCVAGPDMVEMPEQAVVGTFTTATELLFAPQDDAGTGHVMDPGQSLWVFGMDSSGMYYKVLLSGLTFWVPASNIGPNYDDVWNGTPLPTKVVED